jgi:hypothetical protein
MSEKIGKRIVITRRTCGFNFQGRPEDDPEQSGRARPPGRSALAGAKP